MSDSLNEVAVCPLKMLNIGHACVRYFQFSLTFMFVLESVG